MTEPQEFDSIDALFRQTFKDLPEPASPNGWDMPSERVWEHVRTHLPQPKSGWTWRAWSMVSALAVGLALGLYWVSVSPRNTQPASAPLPEEKTVQPPVAEPAIPEAEIAHAQEAPATLPSNVDKATTRKKTQTAQPTTPETGRENLSELNTEEQSARENRPFPNTAERRRAEALRKLWNTPLKPLPTPLEDAKHKF